MVKKNREQEILEAAIKIFSNKGFNGSTTSEIAKEAGVAEGTIFRYFKTKKDILKGVMIRLTGMIGETFVTVRLEKVLKENEGKEEKEILKAVLKDRLEVIEKHMDVLQIILTEIQYHQDLREAFIKHVVTRGRGIMEQFIQKGIERGIFREVDIFIATRSLVGCFGAYMIQRQIAPQMTLMSDDEQLDKIIDIFFYGIAKENPKS